MRSSRPGQNRVRNGVGLAAICGAALLAALVWQVAPSVAGGGPLGRFSADGSAALGTTTLHSAAALSTASRASGASVHYSGSWSSPAAACSARRRLALRVLLVYTPAPGATAKAVSVASGRTALVTNCGGSGLGLEVSLSARREGVACPDGSFQPGSYSLAAQSVMPAGPPEPPDTALRASVTLDASLSAPC